MAHGQQDQGGAQEPDPDPQETADWLEALEGVLATEGVERAHFLIEALIDKARRAGAHLPYKATTAYLNTIHVNDEARNPVTRRSSTACAPTCAGTRSRWSCKANKQLPGHRRAHLDLRVGGDALRRRLQPLLQRPRPP